MAIRQFADLVAALVTVALASVALVLPASAAPSSAEGYNGEIDRLVGRIILPTATLSPNGRYVAVLRARANTSQDRYEMEVAVINTSTQQAKTVSRFSLRPESLYSDLEWIQPTAGSFAWKDDTKLILSTPAPGGMRASIWDVRTSTLTDLGLEGSQVILSRDPSDRLIAFVFSEAKQAKLGSRRFVDSDNPGVRETSTVRDLAMAKGCYVIATAGPTETGCQEAIKRSVHKQEPEALPTADSYSFIIDRTIVHPGSTIFNLVKWHDLLKPGKSRTTSEISLQSQGKITNLVPSGARRMDHEILGWSEKAGKLFYLETDVGEVRLKSVTRKGVTREILVRHSGIRRPSTYPGASASISADGRYAIVVTNSLQHADQLEFVDLVTGRSKTLLPGEPISGVSARLIEVFPEKEAEVIWGHLYLPVKDQGRRLPLVVTSYIARPGYPASVGDEVPIPLLLKSGIAVLNVHARDLNHISSTGDYRMELERVRRPLDAIESMVNQLVRQGWVDEAHVGLSGLSYGAEIATYAAWKSHAFAAASMSTTSWEPSVPYLTGPDFFAYLQKRGMPTLDPKDRSRWAELAITLNDERDLPPIMIQSGEFERMSIAPTWTQLRTKKQVVEWIEFPSEGHIKIHPRSRSEVYSRNLDWFRFWLQGFEDPAPEKEAQYERWTVMRRERQAFEAAH